MDARWVAVALACLVLPQGVTGWSQTAGEPGRRGAAILEPPLDVLVHQAWLPAGETIVHGRELGIAETPHGLFGISVNLTDGFYDRCVLFRVPDPLEAFVERGEVHGCIALKSVVGYHALRDGLLICDRTYFLDPVLRFVDASTGQTRWSIRPDRDFELLGYVDPTLQEELWYCSGVAIDERRGRAVVPFYTMSAGAIRNRVAQIDLDDGSVDWATNVPASVFLDQAESPAEEYYYRPFVATVSESGIALSGMLGLAPALAGTDATPPVQQNAFQWASAWLDGEGNVVGGRMAERNPANLAGRAGSGANVFAGSVWGAANGPEVALALGEGIMVVNPSQTAEVRGGPLRADEDLSSSNWWPATKWWDDTVVVPLPRSVTAYDAATLTDRWTWTPGTGWLVGDVLVAPPYDLYVVAGRNLTERHDVTLFRLGLESGRVHQAIPLALPARFPSADALAGATPEWLVRLQPLMSRNQLLVWDDGGNAAILGTAAEAARPGVAVETAYPRLGAPMTLTLRPPAEGVLSGYRIHWGEGAIEDVPPETRELAHRYVEAGTRTIHVTAIHDDGRTATREIEVYPGQAAPSEDFLQWAFVGDGRDTTWGIIGVLLALGGGAWAYAQARKRRRALGKGFEELDALRRQAQDDPAGALRGANLLARQLHEGLRRGAIDQAEFAAMELRLNRFRSALRARVLASYGARLSARFKHVLHAAFEDATMTQAESESLLAQLSGEKRLNRAERAALAEVIGGLGA